MGIRIRSSLFLILLLLIPSLSWGLQAFPGAQGFGTDTVGGRGGTVYVVDTLSDDPADGVTFREASTASGPRIVVFKVSGVINLTSMMQITTPYLTVAGQTSPGGVQIAGGMVQINTHDVLMTHMRFRMGSHICDTGDCETQGDPVQIMGSSARDVYNVVLDHCSLAWGSDETLDVSSYYGDCYDVTISHCMIARGLNAPSGGGHALGFLISGHYQTSKNITISAHHNHISTFRYRFPIVNGAELDLYNNVMYNWESFAISYDKETDTYPDAHCNFRQNYIKEGPITGTYDSCYRWPTGSHDTATPPGKSICTVYDYDGGASLTITGTPSPIIHAAGNFACDGTSWDDNIWQGTAAGSFLDSGWLSATPIAAATNGDATITTMSAEYASAVVAAAGANRIQSTSSLSPDSLDSEIIADYEAGTGSLVSDKHYGTDAWPTQVTADAWVDSDSDGMADATELVVFGNLTQDGTADSDGDGYSDIEEYLFILGGYQEAGSPSTPSISGGFSGSLQ